jgi:hypothetical protein
MDKHVILMRVKPAWSVQRCMVTLVSLICLTNALRSRAWGVVNGREVCLLTIHRKWRMGWMNWIKYGRPIEALPVAMINPRLFKWISNIANSCQFDSMNYIIARDLTESKSDVVTSVIYLANNIRHRLMGSSNRRQTPMILSSIMQQREPHMYARMPSGVFSEVRKNWSMICARHQINRLSLVSRHWRCSIVGVSPE